MLLIRFCDSGEGCTVLGAMARTSGSKGWQPSTSAWPVGSTLQSLAGRFNKGRLSPPIAPRQPGHGDVTMTTGKKAASAASKVLSNPKSTKADKTAAASDLAQAKHGSPSKKK